MTNRRDLLRYAGATALSQLSSRAAINVIRVGLLGTQHSHLQGKLKAMKDPSDYQVVSICEPDKQARAKAEQNPAYQGLKWVNEDELLSDPSLHLIVVECKAWEAVPWGQKVISAGKHLHLEKPPGNEWGPFKELVEEARRKNLLLQCGYMWRWNEGFLAALEAVRNGWLGDVYMLRGAINSDRDTGGRAIEARYKGGSFFELGGHLIDRVIEVAGRPKKVTSWLRHDTKIADELADNTLVVFEYDHALAVLSSAAKMPGSGDHRSLEVIGSEGSVLVYPETAPPRIRVSMRTPKGPYKAGWQEVKLPPQPRFIGDFKEFARALKSGTPLKLSYDHELLVQETLLRASGEIS